MAYRNDVAEAKRLVKRSEEDQWRLAELTWTNVNEKGTTRTQWAKDVGISSSHANRLCKVWERYSSTATKPKFWDAYEKFTGHGEDATKQSSRADSGIKHASPRAIVREIKRRPEVRRALAESDTFLEVREERAGIDTSKAGRKAAGARGHAAAQPARRLAAVTTITLIVQHMDSAAAELDELLESGDFSGSDIRRIRTAYDRLSEKMAVAEASAELQS